MGTCDRCAPPAQRGGMAGRVREIQADPRIEGDQPRHVARGVQGDLLLGMAPPHPRPAGRVGAARAARFLCVAARGSGGLWLAAVRAGGACRFAGGDRLVDWRIEVGWASVMSRVVSFLLVLVGAVLL